MTDTRERFERVAKRMKEAEPYRACWCDEFIVIESLTAENAALQEVLNHLRESTTDKYLLMHIDATLASGGGCD